ncbi:MAG: HEPN family nuclease [Lachnospiraceae bacterium]|nr:HEPN family nuclease [Lachnospiraceae bacterium]
MGMYSVDTFISDFATRTMDNLKCVQEHNSRYEVTQLINSLFGLLIVPNEKFKYRSDNPQKVPDKVFKAESKFYDKLKCEFGRLERENRYYNNYPTKELVSEIITRFRNALAHSGKEGLHFLPMEEGREISSIIFYDTDNSGHEFCAQLSIEEIRKITMWISKMYQEIEMKLPEVTIEQYKKQLAKYQRIMRKQYED